MSEKEKSIQTTIRITGFNKHREQGSSLDWSYSADIEVEISGAGQSVTQEINIPLDHWQWEGILETKAHAHELLDIRLKERMDTIQRALGEKCLTTCAEHGILRTSQECGEA